jgi:hypothetical protein
MKTYLTVALAIFSTIGLIQPAAAKSVTLLPIACDQGTPTYAVFQKQGSQFILGFRGGAVGGNGFWHTTITDNKTVVLLDYTDDLVRPSPSITTGLTLPKGTHLLDYESVNSTTGETCSFLITTKV